MGLFFAMLFANSGVSAAPAKIGIMVFDGFLTSDVTVPIEVFGAAAKKEQVASEEGLRLVADITIYDEVALDVFIVPSAYEMDALLQDEKLIDYIRKQTQSVSWLARNCSGAFLWCARRQKSDDMGGGESGLQEAYPKIKVQVDKNIVID